MEVRDMERSKDEQCQSCRYWYTGSDNRNQECRRHAPIGIDKYGDAEWPEVYPYTWCGDFEPIPEPESVPAPKVNITKICPNCKHFIDKSTLATVDDCPGYCDIFRYTRCSEFDYRA